MAPNGSLYMGFDLSTQQLKGIVVDSELKLIHEAKVDFDEDLGNKYGVQKGVLTNPEEGEVFAPPAMWLDALNLVLDRLRGAGLDFGKVEALSGAGMQHGIVLWSTDAENLLNSLDAGKTLTEQLEPEALLINLDERKTVHQQLEPDFKAKRKAAFAHPVSPNWQDASTQKQCDAFDAQLGDPETLAEVTGSKAHHRFSGPQIMRYRTKYPSNYASTARISLVSSFLASLLLGRIAPIDISDVTGMNLWDLNKGSWHDQLLELVAGSKDGVPELRQKLGEVSPDGGASLGSISPYFTSRYGFPSSCQIIPFTGDNPSTILSLPLRASDAMVSLGTSTTFLMSTPTYKPDPSYHFMNHPTTKGLYMFMLCYKNGGLAREEVRDHLNSISSSPGLPPSKSWDRFNSSALSTPPLLSQPPPSSSSSPSSPEEMHLGLFFPRPEIVPSLPAGQWRRTFHPSTHTLSSPPSSQSQPPSFSESDARLILESQFLSLRLRSSSLLEPSPSHPDLPPQPGRVYLVGGGSVNPAIAKLAGEILGGREGVYRLDIGGNACALGAAYKAVWGKERKQGEGFEGFIGERWDESGFVERIAEGYTEGVYEKYGVAVEGFEMMEREVVEEVKGRGGR